MMCCGRAATLGALSSQPCDSGDELLGVGIALKVLKPKMPLAVRMGDLK